MKKWDGTRRMLSHDFLIPRKGKAIPYGVYDLTRDEGWVNVGIDHDTGEFGMKLLVRHLPPGTSKWNKVEHRLFSFNTRNWRGRPLTSLAVIVKLIAGTKTKSGLRVGCELDTGRYPKGQKISDEQMAEKSNKLDKFHGDWNYTIQPRAKRSNRPANS